MASGKSITYIGVVLITCGQEAVLVKNATGRRKDWQLPGGALIRGTHFFETILEMIKNETGLQLTVQRIREDRTFTRELHRWRTQKVYFYRAELNPNGLDRLREVSPDGHQVKRVKIDELGSFLGVLDLQVINP